MDRYPTRRMVAMVVVGVLGARSDGGLPGTLNFHNVTATNVHQTVPEQASNEKEVEFGDFDNDGDLDVVIGNAQSDFGQRRNKLYRNDDGVFNEISGNPAIPGFSGTDVTRNAFFRDYDNDGWLDIIVVNDNNTGGDAGRTKIYINQQSGGVFSHYSEEGLARLGAGTGGAACGAVSFDADQDGNIDLYVGNYPGPSQDTMYLDDANGFFTNVTFTHVPADSDYTVDVITGDMNGDGKLDLLISNHSNNKLYYNDLGGAGSGVGDFRYTGSTQVLGNAASSENAMETADFDNDGRMDFYWANRQGGGGDRIYWNAGNDGLGRATFQELAPSTLPPSATTMVSRKATVADLNRDGRMDVIVMKENAGNSRPTILRNTTVGDVISFIDWTPGNAFPNGLTHKGWHAAAFDADGDGRDDIFLGGWNNDSLFQSVDSNEMAESDVTGDIVGLLNSDPRVIVGEVNGDADEYVVSNIGSNRTVSVVLNGCSDFILRAVNAAGQTLAESDRGGLGVEEAMQFTPPNGDFRIQVLINQACGDADADGDADLADVDAMFDCVTGPGGGPSTPCQVFDFDADEDTDFVDFGVMQDVFSGLAAPAGAFYQLEILARS